MSIKPDKTSPYAQPAQYGSTSPRASGEAGDEEEPQRAFSYLAGHTPDKLYATLPHKPPPDGQGEDWLPPLQGGYVKRGLPRHTFSDVGERNPGYTPDEYAQIGNGHHSSVGNLAPSGRAQPRNSNYPADFPATGPNPGDGGYDDPGRYSTAGRGQPRNSNYPSDYTPLGPNAGERQPGHYEEFPDRQPGGHYDAYSAQSTAVDIGMSDMSPTANGPGQDGLDSLKRNRGVRPTTNHTHLGKLSSVSEEPPKEPARYGCLCICAIVVAVVVALAAGFAAGWFLKGMGVAGGAGVTTTTAAVQASVITTTPTGKTTTPTTTTTTSTTTSTPTTALALPVTDTSTTSQTHSTTEKQTTPTKAATTEAITTPVATVADTTAATTTTAAATTT